MKLLFHCLRGPRKLIGWWVQETPICALQRMALAKSLFFNIKTTLYKSCNQNLAILTNQTKTHIVEKYLFKMHL